MDDGLTFGWYGKSPSTGDFVSRRLARTSIHTLDRWFQAGMTALRERAPQTWERDYGMAPIWSALLPARIVSAEACLAVIAASNDRVGRRFPFCVVATLGGTTLARMTSLADCSETVARLVEQSIRASLSSDAFDRELAPLASRFVRDDTGEVSDIGALLDELEIESDDLATVPLTATSAFPWPDLARTFDPAGTTSYWWARVPPGRLASGGFTHSGMLDSTLFVTLFGEPLAPPPGGAAG